MRQLVFVALIMGFASTAQAGSEAYIAKSMYTPFFTGQGETNQVVGPLWVDKFAVTNSQFAAFIKQNPEWSRDHVKSLFAESGYLSQWLGPTKYAKTAAELPVTRVSWFAARKYCESKGKRLLTTSEWEFVSDAQSERTTKLVLEWYSRPAGDLIPARSGIVNAFGLVGMHGNIWEWVEDFSATMISGDANFCGSGSLQSKDPSQYATFMRSAHRSSLSARSVGAALGFRCARDTKGEAQ